MNALKEKYKSRLRKVTFDGSKIIVKVHPSKEWKEICKGLTDKEKVETNMAALISEHILDLDGTPIWTPQEIIDDVCDDITKNLVELIQEVNIGKKKAEVVNLKG